MPAAELQLTVPVLARWSRRVVRLGMTTYDLFLEDERAPPAR
ncbi:hypothetical protein [Actinomycetospora soli]|nr:hypothetical protein [Actinomycetospora soli]